MNIKEFSKELSRSVSNGIAETAQLSAYDIKKMDEKREECFAKLTDKNEVKLQRISEIGVEVFQDYLPKLCKIYRPYVQRGSIENWNDEKRILYFDITKWVTDKEEKSLDKLTNVYQTLSEKDCTIALIYTRHQNCCKVTMGISNNSADDFPKVAKEMCELLRGSLLGNFPGSDIGEAVRGIPQALSNIDNASVAIVSNLASEKSEDYVSQSMEKLLDSIIPRNKDEEYSIVLLAQPMHTVQQEIGKLYEEYTAISPFASWQYNKNINDSYGRNSTASAGVTAGAGFSKGISAGVNAGVSGGISADASISLGANYSRSSGQSRNITWGEGETRSHINYAIKHTMDLIEKQTERLQQCSALGMWDFSAYVISDNTNIAKSVADTYLSLTQGNESYLMRSAINVWSNGLSYKEKETDGAKIILEHVKRLQHPKFCKKENYEKKWYIYPTEVRATVSISSNELAHALNLPRKSVSGLPVFECVPFGREVIKYDYNKEDVKIQLGHISHMRKKENTIVNLDRNSLTSHTFITGSTGSGKSTTVYKLLDEISRTCIEGEDKAVKFMVIEPAKGEYKKVLPKNPHFDVKVYGTNPKIKQLLRINPFKFPADKIHIYEHLDRLTEIFNVCWPMYAAMPAVLKAAMENAYRSAGWNLVKSENKYGNLFPSFVDVAIEVEKYINKSAYSAENKSNYKGSLLTRLESLTNGINSMIFSADDIDDQELFDENVIIDLSRIGSTETKALIMGILLLKLQEYRIANAKGSNSKLRHVTVLEEAHNLLKRTSTEQSSETANLLGKSVEMLANSIAEMRSYGEGFIIADQSPGLLDMSVIRNTNTKIIMRLPDFSDRELVGKSAGLNEDQIVELSKLACGVAAVYQNDWIEPVLCCVEKPNLIEGEFDDPALLKDANDDQLLFDLLDSKFRAKLDDIQFEEAFKASVNKSKLPTETKIRLLEFLREKQNAKGIRVLASLIFDYFDNTKEVLENSVDEISIEDLKTSIMAELSPSIIDFGEEQINLLITLIFKEYVDRYHVDYPIWHDFTANTMRRDVR